MSIMLAPGVREFEHPSGASFARGAISNRLLAIGMARRGPVGRPISLRSYEQFVAEFGDDLQYGELAIQMRQFFTAGGGDAVVVRAAHLAAPTTLTLQDEFGNDALLMTAADEGVQGRQLRALVDYDTQDPELTFNLTFFRETLDAQGRPQRKDQEIFQALSMDRQLPNFVENVVNGVSDLVTVRSLATEPDMTIDNSAQVYSQSALYFANAAALDAHLAATASDASINLEVDGQIVGPISLPGPLARPTIQTAISNALASQSIDSQITVALHPNTNGTCLRFEADGTDGTRTVKVLPGLGVDGTPALGMGAFQGGIEVGLYSVLRPQMSGLTSRLFDAGDGAGVINGTLEVIGSVAPGGGALPFETDFADGTADAVVNGLEFGQAGATSLMDDGDAGTPLSLNSLRANLDSLVALLNASDPLSDYWTFDRIGVRLRGLRNDGNLAAAAAGAFTSTGPIGYLNNAGAIRSSFALGQDVGDAGSDGTAPVPADYLTYYTRVSREVDIFNMLILPRGHNQSDVQRGANWGPASAFCRDQNALLIIDPLSDNQAWSDVDEVVAQPGLTEFKSGIVPEVSCTFWPRIRTTIGTNQVHVDPAGTIAGVIAGSIARTGVWNAAAGLAAPLIGARGLEHPMSDADNGVINPRGINALRSKSTGNVNWGYRTLAGDDAFSNRDFAYINPRMTTDFIKNSLSQALEGYVFQLNNAKTWASIEMMCRAFMQGLYEKGAFRGTSASQAYDVKCNKLTTSQADIALGFLNLWVMFAPNFPAEFIHLHIQHKILQPAA